MRPATFSYSILTDRACMTATSTFYQTHFDLAPTLDIGWFESLRRADDSWELCLWDAAHESVPQGMNVTPGGGLLAFIVDDAAGYAARLAESGANLVSTVIDEPWGQRHFYVTDPAGTMIDVVEVTTPDPAWLAAQGLS